MQITAMRHLLTLVSLLAACSTCFASKEIDFNRDIRPILSGHCFKCHGPDDSTRQAGLRFDLREGALAEADSGAVAIVAGDPAASEMIARIEADDDSLLMPPPEANKPLSAEQKEMLKSWIEAGAPYEKHWAFVSPAKAPLPKVAAKGWPRNAIDYFILSRLEREGLSPAPEANRYKLLRRLSLDLIGLPPTPEEIASFVEDPAPDAYEKVVDRLLASPHFGERWARRWLDLARYADTNGYEKDRVRSIWPYRDWVIGAINADMPYDQFSIEQLAGDMLPSASQSQRIATGLHRNTMLNEEGGIDPLEFRYYAVVDRVNTTSTIWLGMTFGCAQCHTHKYDPVTHHDYYRLMAYLNNADEPVMDVVDAETEAQRQKIQQQIAKMESELPLQFPPEGNIRWHDVTMTDLQATSGVDLKQASDSSIHVSGVVPDKDEYVLKFTSTISNPRFLQIEALTDPNLPQQGPGRTPHGNIVLTEVAAEVRPSESAATETIAWESVSADFHQEGFPAEHTYDGNPQSGWAIHGPDPWNVDRQMRMKFSSPLVTKGAHLWTVRLQQHYGGSHTIGRFRIRLGEEITDNRPEHVRRQEHLERRLGEWIAAESRQVHRWQLLKPLAASSEIPTLTIADDHSILASGDQSKRDVYRIKLHSDMPKITALRLEVLPHESLPQNGPGRIAYEGPFGDFFLSEITVQANGGAAPFHESSHSFASGKNTSEAAIDGDPQTGWSINGGQGKAHSAVFRFAEPISTEEALELELLFERFYAAGLGRFRVWATADEGAVRANSLPTEIEQALLLSQNQWSDAMQAKIRAYYLSIAPELAPQRAEIEKLRASLPSFPTTLVMKERPAEHPRQTFLHHRGEFLQPKEAVTPKLPSLFETMASENPTNRLELAQWLVSVENPLGARVAVNRLWGTIFGRGLVRTTEDFGYQGEAPTHPELLDWLAVEMRENGWSRKKLLKLIVTSDTYRQSAESAPEKFAKDPENKWLSRAPRVRLEAELVRDLLLQASGLLSKRIGGPSVFPPQPPGVTSEGTYGPLEWKLSEGEDRYRRGLYTFAKRTAPYAMFLTFDGPSGEACIARRDNSNTPLQALTLLNDTVVMEAAQALGTQLKPRSPAEGIEELYLRCLGRPPSPAEQEILMEFHQTNLGRLQDQELNAKKITGAEDGDSLAAAWTLTARAVLNLDETMTEE